MDLINLKVKSHYEINIYNNQLVFTQESAVPVLIAQAEFVKAIDGYLEQINKRLFRAEIVSRKIKENTKIIEEEETIEFNDRKITITLKIFKEVCHV